MAIVDRDSRVGAEFANIVAEVFRKANWRVRSEPATGDMRADLVVEHGSQQYVVEVKSAAEGRRDRLVPLMSQAILEAQSRARLSAERVSPLAVVAAKRVSKAVVEHIRQFAARHAPGVSIGVVDEEGLSCFVGSGLEGLDAGPRRQARHDMQPVHWPDLFSDLNQWMLKILLGRDLPEAFISVPRGPIRHATHLAAAARVSVMTASRFVNQLKGEGFLDDNQECLQIVRTDELMQRWISASRQMSRDIPARWIIRKGVPQFLEGVARYAVESGKALHSGTRSKKSEIIKGAPRLCIGVFAAADALGAGFVRGATPHLYLERLDPDVLQALGLSAQDAGRSADVFVRIPANRESVFRAAVHRDGLPVSDILQIWLDASANPARGREQADEIRRRVLKPVFGKNT